VTGPGAGSSPAAGSGSAGGSGSAAGKGTGASTGAPGASAAEDSGGVPPRPQPLPPPRSVAVPPGGMGSAAPAVTERTSTVVPERGARPAAPRPPLSRPPTPVRGRRAKLAVRRLDPWSVFVVSLLLSLFLAVVTIVASLVLYAILSALGVPGSVNDAISEVNGSGPLLTKGRFIGFASLVAAANVVLLTVLSTVGAMLYNVCATFTGGVELTLAERD
jgi:hypothetical protein